MTASNNWATRVVCRAHSCRDFFAMYVASLHHASREKAILVLLHKRYTYNIYVGAKKSDKIYKFINFILNIRLLTNFFWLPLLRPYAATACIGLASGGIFLSTTLRSTSNG